MQTKNNSGLHAPNRAKRNQFFILSSHSQRIPHPDLIFRREMIHLVETLQTDAVILCDAIHAFAGLHHVRTLSVSLLSPALLLLQIDSLVWGESVALAALVVAGNLAGREPKLLAQRLEGVARLTFI